MITGAILLPFVAITPVNQDELNLQMKTHIIENGTGIINIDFQVFNLHNTVSIIHSLFYSHQ